MARYTGGWFKAWRKAVESDLIGNVHLWAVWNALLYAATWKPSKILWNGEQREIPPGSILMGVKEFADKWDCSQSVIRKWLKYLEKTDRVVIETCARGTLITIRNWEIYQSHEEEVCAPRVNDVQTACEPRVNDARLNEEGKKGRTKKEDISNADGSAPATPRFDFETIYLAYPKRKGDQGKAKAMKWLARNITSQAKYDRLLAAVQKYDAHCREERKVGTEYVKQFKTFLGVWEEWEQLDPQGAQDDFWAGWEHLPGVGGQA